MPKRCAYGFSGKTRTNNHIFSSDCRTSFQQYRHNSSEYRLSNQYIFMFDVIRIIPRSSPKRFEG